MRRGRARRRRADRVVGGVGPRRRPARAAHRARARRRRRVADAGHGARSLGVARAGARRRRAGRGRLPARGAVRVDAQARRRRGARVDRARRRAARGRRCAALVDESAGYHARHTAWRWSAGVGVAASGEPVAWNLVDGIHDDAAASERDRVGGRRAARGRAGRRSPTTCSAVGGLRFAAEAMRARRENLLRPALGLRAAVRRVLRRAARGGPAARGLGRDGAPRGALVVEALASPRSPRRWPPRSRVRRLPESLVALGGARAAAS